jgi:hypothetical protein
MIPSKGFIDFFSMAKFLVDEVRLTFEAICYT